MTRWAAEWVGKVARRHVVRRVDIDHDRGMSRMMTSIR